MSPERAAVVGGGPAGLVAARHLAESDVDVTVYEASDRVGGRVRSRQEGDFTLDRGFQVLLTGFPAVQRELDLDPLDLRTFAPGAVICEPHRRSVLADPLGDPRAIAETLFNTRVTTGDKLRLWRYRRSLTSTTYGTIFSGPDRSIREELADRGFSESFVESFAEPFFGGITLDRSLSTSKRVMEAVLKAIGEGDVAVPAAGMSAVADQLADRARSAGATIETGVRATEVVADDTGARVTLDREADDTEQIDARACVVATDPRSTRDLTGIDSIPAEGVGCVTQYYSVPPDAAPDGTRLHLDATEGGPNHVVTLSNVAPEYAGGDRALVSATFLGDPDASNALLDDRTRRTLGAWYPERHYGDVELLATDRIPFAQFAQPPGRHDDLPAVADPEGRCYLAGEYTRWSSLAAAMESGRTAAQRVLATR